MLQISTCRNLDLQITESTLLSCPAAASYLVHATGCSSQLMSETSAKHSARAQSEAMPISVTGFAEHKVTYCKQTPLIYRPWLPQPVYMSMHHSKKLKSNPANSSQLIMHTHSTIGTCILPHDFQKPEPATSTEDLTSKVGH